MTFRAFLAGCWRSHDHVRARNAKGEAVLKCQDCGEEQPMFQSEIIRCGPKHQPDRVLGQPTTGAKKVRADNRIDFPRQSER